MRSIAFAAACALLLTVCGREPTSPTSKSEAGIARLLLQPGFSDATRPLFQASGASIDNVHLVIRSATGTIVLDTVVTFPPGQDQVSITADVLVRGETEQFVASIELRAGTTVIFEGTQDLTARPGVTVTTPTIVPQTFVGPGATATRVTVTPSTATVLAGSTTNFTATAFDAANAPIPGALIAWTSSNPVVANATPGGVVIAGAARGSATITASTLSGIVGSAEITVTLPASRIVILSGDAQAARVGTQLPEPLVVRLEAADGAAIAGAAIAFSTTANGATVGSASATTDATGRASTTMTLGGNVGAQNFRAAVGALFVTATQTAMPGLSSGIVILSGNAQVDTIGRALPLPFVVKVTDSFGNVVPNVTVTWTRTAGAGTLGAPTSTTDAQGVAQVNYTLGNVAGTETASASVTTAGDVASVSFTATALARPAATIAIVSGDAQAGPVGQPVALPLIVVVRDVQGIAVANAPVDWTVVGSATISAPSSTTDALGRTQVSATFTATPGAATITARLATNAAVSIAFTVTATTGAADKLLIANGTAQTAAAGSPVATAPAVLLTDQFDNPIAGVAVTFTPSSGGAVTGSPATTNASGIATLGSWTLGGAAGPQTLTAMALGLTVTFTATATAPVGPSVLSMAAQPSVNVQNTVVFPQQPSIQLKTAGGANLSTAGVVVSVALQTAGPVLRGVLTATTDTSGKAFFTNLSVLGSVGANALVFSAGGYTGVTSGAINITPGPAIYISPTTATSFAAPAGSLVTPNSQVIVKDSSNNPVPGVTVTFATPAAGNGIVVTGTGSLTGASGNANPTSWTLDNTVGADTMTATVVGLVGSPVTFVATTSAGAVTQLVIASGNNQTGVTGTPLAAPMIVVAKDALNNPVSGVNIDFTVTAGGGTPASQTIATDGGGQASFTLTLGPPGGQAVQACLPSCATAQVNFAATSIPVGADATWNGATDGSWTTASNWSPAAVPSAASNVFIPAGTANSPVMPSPVTVNDLTLANGATLNIGSNQLTVSGNLNAGTTIVGTAAVRMTGAGKQVSGVLPSLIVDAGNVVTAAGSVTVNGDLTTNGGAVFDVSAATVTVTGSIAMLGGSRIKMVSAGGHLIVVGNYDSNPGNDIGDTWMTDGLLEIKGNMTALNGGVSQNFRAVGNHITRFSGSSPQSIDFTYTDGYNRSTFGNVEFTGGNTVTLVNGMRAFGGITLTSATTLTGNTTIYHMGQLTTTAGTSLAGLAATELNSGGVFFPIIAGAAPPQVTLNAGAVVKLPAASVTYPGNLVVTGGTTLDLEAKELIVTGNFGMYGGSRVKMINSATHFVVNGNYDSNPGNDIGDTWMTDGLLEIKGNMTALNAGVGQNFRAVGNHITRFNGGGAQSINFTYTDGYNRSTFGHVEFASGQTITLVNGARVFGTVLVNNNTTVTGLGMTIYHMGQLTTTAGTSLAGLAATELNSAGALFPIIAGAAPPQVTLNAGGTIQLPAASVTYPGNLVVTGGTTLDLEAKELIVTGNFGMYGGSRVKMINSATHFVVNGNYDSNPGNDIGDTWMTDGLLEIKGNMTALNGGVSQSFRAVGSHLTRFNGGSAQSINFTYTDGYNRSTFGHVEFSSGQTITLVNGARMFGTVLVNNNTTVTGPGMTIFHMGQLTTTAGTSLAGLASTELNSGGALFPIIAGTAPPQVTLNAGGTIQLPAASVTYPGNLVVTGSTTFDLEAKELIVTGNFGMYGGSRVKMINSATHFVVNGNYDSNPGNDIGDTWMTDGLLEIKGNMTALNAGVGQNFRAVGNHITRFNGGGAQSINFTYTDGYNRSTFGHVEFASGQTITLVNGARVFGTVLVNGNTTVTGSGATIYHLGQLTTTAGTSLSGLASTQLEAGGALFPLIAGTAPPLVNIIGNFTVTLPAGTVTLPTSLTIQSSTILDVEGKSLTVTGNFGMYSSSRVRMTNAAAVFTVNGNYDSNPGNDIGDTWMTNGLLDIKGNLTALNGGVSQNFRAVGSHITRFSGTGAQTINFTYAENAGRSTFGNVEVTNASGSGLAMLSDLWVFGNLTNTGRFSIPSGTVSTIQGTLFLGPTSVTTNSGTLTKAACSIISGSPTFSGFSCP